MTNLIGCIGCAAGMVIMNYLPFPLFLDFTLVVGLGLGFGYFITRYLERYISREP